MKLKLVQFGAIGTAAFLCALGSVYAQSTSSGGGSAAGTTNSGPTTGAGDDSTFTGGANRNDGERFHSGKSGDTHGACSTSNTPDPYAESSENTNNPTNDAPDRPPSYKNPTPWGATDPRGTMQPNDLQGAGPSAIAEQGA